jgi:hypothetical protein
MKVMFASGDVGGARALMPVIHACETNGLSFVVVANGHIAGEAPPHWPMVTFDRCAVEELIHPFFKKHRIGAFVFASSVKDDLALRLARHAARAHLPTIHVLDAWSGYRRRMEIDGLPAFMPDRYAVMDEVARQEAVQDGLDPAILAVTGQPDLALLPLESDRFDTRNITEQRLRLELDPRKAWIVFVSEPVEQDQGGAPELPQYRGYTEKDVLRLFCDALQPLADRIEIGILPHPREDGTALEAFWCRHRGTLQGQLIRLTRGREAVLLADGVVGMCSILLYEAWLLGKPTLSLQPGLRQNSLRVLEQRQGVVFVDSYQNATSGIRAWAAAVRPLQPSIPQPDLCLHAAAPANVFKLIEASLQQAAGNLRP